MDFYSNKPKNLPRMIYRILAELSQSKTIGDDDLAEMVSDTIKTSRQSDFLKFTWVFPEKFKALISQRLLEKIEKIIAEKRGRKPLVLKKHVYPHVSDEFSLEQDFLSSIFSLDRLPEISNNDIFYSVGSCFAGNFATYLRSKGLNASNYAQSEDLNSPGSNSLLMEYAVNVSDINFRSKLEAHINQYWNDLSISERDKLLDSKIREICQLRDSISSASKIVITLGNTIDFYHTENDKNHLTPKFIAMNSTEDIDERSSIASKLLKNGSFIRLSTFHEVEEYISVIYKSIRSINKIASIIFTVSPVPIDSVLGIKENTGLTAVEIDCVSKSTIRTALNEFLNKDFSLQDKNLYYLPSFEIVRWVAPNTGIEIFGAEDASSRHVSNKILNAICRFAFTRKI